METELLKISKAARIIGSKWTLLILGSLLNGTKRFGQLQKELGDINPRTLSKKLKELEKEGYIRKKIYPQVPPKVEYSLTKKGQIFKKIIRELRSCNKKM